MCEDPSDVSFLHGITATPLALEVCYRTSGHREEMLEPLSICALQGRRLLSLPVVKFPAEADEVTHCGLNTLEDLLCSRPCMQLPLQRKSKAPRLSLC